MAESFGAKCTKLILFLFNFIFWVSRQQFFFVFSNEGLEKAQLISLRICVKESENLTFFPDHRVCITRSGCVVGGRQECGELHWGDHLGLGGSLPGRGFLGSHRHWIVHLPCRLLRLRWCHQREQSPHRLSEYSPLFVTFFGLWVTLAWSLSFSRRSRRRRPGSIPKPQTNLQLTAKTPSQLPIQFSCVITSIATSTSIGWAPRSGNQPGCQPSGFNSASETACGMF